MKRTALLDVNVLVALAWPNHVHHEAAHAWFGTISEEQTGWATCPLTESAFVRVSSNPRSNPDARTPFEAVTLLRRMASLPGHRFWPDDVSLAAQPDLPLDRLRGHRQVTGAHLLVLALRHRGRLVTFDRGIVDLVPDGTSVSDVVLLLG